MLAPRSREGSQTYLDDFGSCVMAALDLDLPDSVDLLDKHAALALHGGPWTFGCSELLRGVLDLFVVALPQEML